MTNSLNQAAIDQLFTKARTVHAFKPEPVSDEQIKALYDIFKW